MEVEITYNQLKAIFSKEELEKMALNMQQRLKENNQIVSMEFCLETISLQFGFKYQEIINKLEDIAYQRQKYHLKDEWVKQFMSLNFPGWKIKICEIEECPDFIEYEIFGEYKGNHLDLDDVYHIIWENLLEIIYLELLINPIEEFKFTDKNQLEKHLLQSASPDTPIVNSILHKIHKNMDELPHNNKIQLLNNIAYDYLPGLTDNKILYNINN